MSACYCIGPQNGEPLCPCRMRDQGVVQRNGRWIQTEKDLGEVNLNDKIWREVWLKDLTT